MTILTYDQTSAYATQAGFSGDTLKTILAIAVCESGLNTQATNSVGNSAGTDRGIVQINSYYHSEVSDTCAFDPACSLQEAYRISSGGTNFSPWATYTNGCYLQYLSGYTPSKLSSALPTAPTTNVTTSTLTSGLGLLSGLGQWVTNPLRLTKMVVGIILIGLSIVLLIMPEAQQALNEVM